jgi:hypothetical protein
MINYEGCYRSAIDDALHGYIISVPDNYNANGAKLPVIFSIQGLGCQPGNFDVNISRIIQYPAPYHTEINLHTMIYNHGLEVPAVVAAIQFAKWENIWNAGVINEFIDIVTGRINVPSANQPSSPVDGASPLNGLHKYNVDWNKVHLTAISQGGQGCTDLLNTNWAKICTFSTFGGVSTWYAIDTVKGARINKAFIRHHTGDPVVSVDFARNLRTAIVNGHSGDTDRVDFVEKPLNTHEVWSEEYQKDVYDPTGVIAFHIAHSLQDFGFPDQNPVPPVPEPIPPFSPVYDIYRNGIIRGRIRPTDGEQIKAIMGVDNVKMNFTSIYYLPLELGDYIYVFEQKYKLNRLPNVVKKSNSEYLYSIEFEALFYDLSKFSYLFLGADNSLTEVDFSLMGNARVFAQLVCDNANRVDSDWQLGEIEETESINLSFSGENCLSCLNRIATEFKTEFWFQDKTINISKKAITTPLVLEYGQGKGLYELRRTNIDADVFTRLYAYGSSRNLPVGYRNFSKRLRLPASSFLEANVAHYGIIEKSIIFDDIYPKREGIVTATDSFDTFVDATIDFNVNEHLLPGLSAKVSFITGQLAGYELEANFTNGTKRFKLFKNNDEKALDVPSVYLRPAIGDKYVLIDIAMPAAYVTAGENTLLEKAQSELEFNSSPRVQYDLSADPIHFKRNNIQPKIFDTTRVLDSVMQIDKTIRIVSLRRSIVDFYVYPEIKLSETVAPAAIVRQAQAAQDLERAIVNNRLYDVNRQRFGFKTATESINSAFDTSSDIFNEKIKPVIVETAGLIVGQESQQFTLVNILFQTNYNGDPNAFVATAGKLVHFTINDNNTVREWNLSSYSRSDLTAQLYYLYAKCEKVGTSGTFLLSPLQIKTGDDASYFHFLIGSISTPIDNVREPSFSYGFTTINGKFIKAGRISSQDGSTYLDLDTNVFRGNLQFTNGDSVQNSIEAVNSKATEAKNFIDTVLPVELQEIRDQLDGVIQSWFDVHVPDLTNHPAVEWTTNAIKDEHLGDLFYNNDTGLGYRFSKLGSTYIWQELNDTDAAAALALAQQAKDTADGKMRVFVVQPFTPYEVGDLWAQGATGDLMRCVTTRLTGTYLAADWQKASKYTDDTVANSAVNAAAFAQLQANNAKATADRIALINDYLYTTINGNVISTGITLYGDALGNNLAFMSGVVDNGLDTILIGSGGSYENRNSLPFRVNLRGDMFASSGVIGRWSLSNNGLFHIPFQINGENGIDLDRVNGRVVVKTYILENPGQPFPFFREEKTTMSKDGFNTPKTTLTGAFGTALDRVTAAGNYFVGEYSSTVHVRAAATVYLPVSNRFNGRVIKVINHHTAAINVSGNTKNIRTTATAADIINNLPSGGTYILTWDGDGDEWVRD